MKTAASMGELAVGKLKLNLLFRGSYRCAQASLISIGTLYFLEAEQ